jgi:putative acetyltransferase
VHFLVARYQGHAVGCGALVVKDLDWGELKRMYVRPVARGKGLGRAILENLLDMAQRRDLAFVRLETGLKLNAAVALYREKGFVEREAFGDYVGDDAPESLFMELSLRG